MNREAEREHKIRARPTQLRRPANYLRRHAFVPVAFARRLPRLVKAPPTGPDWIYEIKHDGFRIIARRDGDKVRLISRNGKDLTYRFPFAVQAVAALSVHSCVVDGEAIVSDPTGLSVFSLIRSYRNGPRATLCAFDLIEIDGAPRARCSAERLDNSVTALPSTWTRILGALCGLVFFVARGTKRHSTGPAAA